MFNRKRLSLARMRRRLTGKGLAELSGLSAVTISRLEQGDNEPDQDTIRRLASALRYPEAFFDGDDPEELPTESVSFRSLKRMSAKERDAAIAAGVLGTQLCEWIESRFSLPKSDLLDLSYESDPANAARSLRQYWGLGEKPIGNMLRLLESKGVRVLSLTENTADVDAFSFWRDANPFVYLNNFKTAEHSIFDSAHELGHLVLHKHGGPKQSRSAEHDANLFASAFLMPEEDVRSRMPRLINANVVIKAKARWRVSAMAMAYRLHHLGLLSDWQYRSVCIELGKRGFRSAEPGGIDRERSVIWHKVFTQLWSERTTKKEIAEKLNLPLDELQGLVFGLAGELNSPASGGNRGQLRIVN
jgi:Zn-dependent peptidase ImmA (M78 family)